VTLAQPAVDVAARVRALGQGDLRLLNDPQVIGGDRLLSLLLGPIKRFGQHEVSFRLDLARELLRSHQTIDELRGGVGTIVLKQLAGDEKFLVKRDPRAGINIQTSRGDEEGERQQQERQLPEDREPTPSAASVHVASVPFPVRPASRTLKTWS